MSNIALSTADSHHTPSVTSQVVEVPATDMVPPQSSTYEIDKLISECQDILSSLPQSHRMRPAWLSGLAMGRLRRYYLSDDEQDLDTSILHFTHAILLPFHFSTERGPNPISAFLFLTRALLHRLQRFKNLSDLKCCVQYLHHLRDRSLEPFDVSYYDVMSLLTLALAHQVSLEPSRAVQAIEEMSILCRALLASDVSMDPPLEDAIANLAEAVNHVIVQSRDQPSEQVIGCLREANRRLPGLHEASTALSWSLFMRFNATQSHDDYEDAKAVLDQIITSRSESNAVNPGGHVKEASSLAATLAFGRWAFYQKPEYLEEAISRHRAHLNTMSLEDSERGNEKHSLVELERRRCDEFGIAHDLPEQHFGVIDIPPFSQLAASLDNSNICPLDVKDWNLHFEAIASMYRITDKAEIEEGVKYCRVLLASLRTGPGDLGMHILTVMLGELLLRAFRCTNKSEYLEESITIFRGLLKIPDAQWIHFRVLRQLISSLTFRFKLLDDRKDFCEIMQLFPVAANDTYAKIPDRFEVSCQWARVARASGHTSISTAYDNAIMLMQETLTFAPTLEIQHSHLVTVQYDYETLPLDHASYLIHIGQLRQAIETLERGRGLLLSELHGFRTSIDHLRALDLPLATKFVALNRELEALATSVSPVVWINDRTSNDQGVDPLGHLVTQQRKLLRERDALISRIQALPGFETFLAVPSFETLQCAADDGPVIVINHSQWRSDIIILLYNSPPSLLPTSDDFYDRVNDLRDQLLSARKKDIDSKEYEDALSSVLKSLYDLIGKPVLDKLRDLNVSEQSRVWWCPTSVFYSLPLHAMGPIRSEGGDKVYFSDLYISSYTPTLSTLIEARKRGTRTPEKPSILLVAQPDTTLPGASKERRVVEAVCPSVTALTRKMATPPVVLERLRDHPFVHISCHGKLEIGKPFDASFKLYRGTRLTLLDIVRSQLSTAEFAFLSACHTAEMTEGSIADEALHLTAALQYCGFRSVVGTMWAMADVDGPKLARKFYRSVFSDGWEGIPYYERTAKALRDAVGELRREREMTLERWVNFVHYGA